MQVEAILFNKSTDNQINATNLNNLSEPAGSYPVTTDRVIIGSDSVKSLDVYNKNNPADSESTKSGDTITGQNQLEASKESINQLINSIIY